MKIIIHLPIILGLIVAAPLHAAEIPKAETISLKNFLQDVQVQNAEVKSLTQTVESLQHKVAESRLSVTPEFFSELTYMDDKSPAANAFSPSRTWNRGFGLGVRSQTTFGLSGEIKFSSNQTLLEGVPLQYLPEPDNNATALSLSFKQALWRNGFGKATRSQIEAQDLGVKSELHQTQYKLKLILLSAENLYWTLSTLQRVMTLQEESIKNAETTTTLMERKVKQNLADDVDALQTKAALEARRLELSQSHDSYLTALRQFNRLRGQGSEVAATVEEFPQTEWKTLLATYQDKAARREDFTAMRTVSEITQVQASMAISNLWPDLSLFGTMVTNGRRPEFSDSMQQLEEGKYPKWVVGIEFSVPLSLSGLEETRRSYQFKKASGDLAKIHADDLEQRTWLEVKSKAKQALEILDRAEHLESLQTELIKLERVRLRNGRSTTFQVLQAEQNLANSQIQKARAQLQMAQAMNEIKTFDVLGSGGRL